MKARRRPAFAVLVASMLFAGAAAAQSATIRPLDRQVAHEMFGALDMGNLLKEEAAKAPTFKQFDSFRPGWRGLKIEALDEVVVQDQGAIEEVLARSLAKTMTEDELSAALTVFRDPQARMMIAASARHQPLPNGTGSCSSACMRAMSSPAGRSFVRKMDVAFGPEAEHEMAAAIAPDLFIRFGEKAKAEEAKRAAP